MQVAPKVHYALCPRGGYHTGEALNMVCLEAKCQAFQLCCCACVEEAHKDHNTKPLRVLMLEAQQAASKIVPAKFSIDAALQLLQSHEKQSMEMFGKRKQEVLEAMQQLETTLRDYYRFLADQVRLKSIDPKVEIQKAFLTIQAPVAKQEDYQAAVRRVAGLLNSKKEEGELTENDVISSLNASNDDLRKKLQTNSEEVNKQLQKYIKELNDSIRDDNLWKHGAVFRFSPTLKHPDIKLLSEHHVKSANNSGYKFVVMEPQAETGGVRKLTFRIKESLSNWVAVGVCHPKVVASKNYGFNFSAIGHGGYMVSANGGSWSHTKAQHNNSVKAFKFGKGDIIQVTLSPNEKSLLFRKGAETYQLPYESIPGDELSPCVLFYYLNDQVEFLPDYKG